MKSSQLLTKGQNLSWNKHIDNITKKAYEKKYSCSRQVKAQCFTMIVHPNLEYAATEWDPYTKYNINKLGKCQLRVARFVNGEYSRESSVTSMLKELKRKTNTKMVRDRPFNLQGGVMVFCFVQIFRIFNFFSEFNIRLYDKNSESDFFFPPPKSEYFFQQHWESE